MTDIHTWKIKRGTEVVAQVLSFVKAIEQKKNVAKALDGSIYIQTIGIGTVYANVEALSTRDEKYALDQAEADGATIHVVYDTHSYTGYIEEAPEWETVKAGEYYRASFKFLIENEETITNN